MPSSLQARMIRRAISPRLAMRILENMRGRHEGIEARRHEGRGGKFFTVPSLRAFVPTCLRASFLSTFRRYEETQVMRTVDHRQAAHVVVADLAEESMRGEFAGERFESLQ